MAEESSNKTIIGRIGGWLRGDDLAAKRTATAPSEVKDGGASGTFSYSPYTNLANWAGPLNTAGSYGTTLNYNTSAGDLIDNSAVMACILWIMRTFAQVPMHIEERTADGMTKVDPHPLTDLLAHPNPAYSGQLLWQPTLLSFNWNGNAYWRKVRNGYGRTIRLYYEPHWNMRPVRASGDDYISFYQIWRNRVWQRVEVEEIVHFRNGLDPRNDMLGLSPLGAALREVATDNEAARYAYSLFLNMGVPGVILTPRTADILINPEQIKSLYIEKTTGDRRGEPLVMDVPLDAQWPPNGPDKMNTRDNRAITEERISALLGVPAVVAQLGAGLAHSTYSNMDSAIAMAYTSNLIPTMLLFSNELDVQLLPEFGDNSRQDIVFDTSGVRALQENDTDKHRATATAWDSGYMTLGQAQVRHNLPLDDFATLYKWQIPGHGNGFEAAAQAPAATTLAMEQGLIDAGGTPPPLPPPKMLLAGSGGGVKAKAQADARDKLEKKMHTTVADYLEGEYTAVASHIEGGA